MEINKIKEMYEEINNSVDNRELNEQVLIIKNYKSQSINEIQQHSIIYN